MSFIQDMFLLTAAIDYAHNGEFSIVRGARERLADRRRHESPQDRRMREARRSVVARWRSRLGLGGAKGAAASGKGHWKRKGDSADARLQQMIVADMPRTTVANMLRRCETRRSRAALLRELGLDESVAPAFYEWLCGIAWFWVSDSPYDVRKAMHLRMDADFRPVSCAAAGTGDVLADYPGRPYAVLMEMSLMNLHNQRRNEWEPAIRHTAEAAAELGKDVYTIFVAPELDENTVNVWKGVASTDVTARDGSRHRCRIMPVTSGILADWVERSVTATQVLAMVDEAYRDEVGRSFDGDWWRRATSNL